MFFLISRDGLGTGISPGHPSTQTLQFKLVFPDPAKEPPELQGLQPPAPLKNAGSWLRIERLSAKRNLPLHKHRRQIKNGKREIKTFKVQTLFGAF